MTSEGARAYLVTVAHRGRRAVRSRLVMPLLALGAWCAGRAAADPPPDLVLTNAKVFTGDPARPWAEALAIRGDRVGAVGARAEIEALAAPGATNVIDAGGRTVIPGINDAHVHAPEVWHPVEVDTGTRDASAQEILAAVSRTAAHTPEGAWIHGDLGTAALDDPALGREALDRVAPRHRVWLDNFAGHATILGSLALRAVGVDEAARPPAGGFHGRNRTGRLDGRVDEYARWVAIRRIASEVGDAAIAREALALSRQAARYGITTLQDMSNAIDAQRLAHVLRKDPPPLRWRIIRFPLGGIERPKPEAGAPSDLVRVSGTKYILDGTPIERGAAMLQPYSDRPGWSGRLNFDAADVRRMLREALRSGEQLHLHVAGDRTLRVVLDEMEATADTATWRRHRLVVEHGDAVGAGELERVRRLGIVVVQNPSHFTRPELIRRRLGARAERWFALRSMVEAGIPVALGSDGPLNPWLNLLFATTHAVAPEEALTREQAVAAYTRGSAYDEGFEGEKGALAAGMLADMALLSQDPFTVPAARLPETHSVLTIVGGRIVHDELGARR